jgi:hypothetical protein
MIEAKVDYNSWFKKWNSLEVQVLQVSEKALKQVATELYTKIVSYTPVGDPSLWKSPYVPKGYKPGTLKKSWAIDIQPREATISNDQPYAQRVENGWSTQAPYGMMRKGIADFPKLLEQAATRYKF